MSHQASADEHATVVAQVAAVWQRVLNIKGDVRHDADFMRLGGDSLMLLSIMTEVEEMFGVELDVEQVVEDLTVNGMANTVLAARVG
jgi:acyl carrier protein